MKIVRKFLANIRQKLFAARTSREIYQKIFPHLNQNADHGYPFGSDDEIVKLHIQGNLTAHGTLHLIERAAGKMPKAEGDAFRYIAYRDLNERMTLYLEFAEVRAYHEDCAPQLVTSRV
jgi:hypothetical protein